MWEGNGTSVRAEVWLQRNRVWRTRYISLQNLGLNWGPSSHQSTLHNKCLRNPWAKTNVTSLACSQFPQRATSLRLYIRHGNSKDLWYGHWCCIFCFFSMWKPIFRRAECSKMYLKPVEIFFGSLRSVLYSWLWKFKHSLLCLTSYKQCAPLTLLPQFPICNMGVRPSLHLRWSLSNHTHGCL